MFRVFQDTVWAFSSFIAAKVLGLVTTGALMFVVMNFFGLLCLIPFGVGAYFLNAPARFPSVFTSSNVDWEAYGGGDAV